MVITVCNCESYMQIGAALKLSKLLFQLIEPNFIDMSSPSDCRRSVSQCPPFLQSPIAIIITIFIIIFDIIVPSTFRFTPNRHWIRDEWQLNYIVLSSLSHEMKWQNVTTDHSIEFFFFFFFLLFILQQQKWWYLLLHTHVLVHDEEKAAMITCKNDAKCIRKHEHSRLETKGEASK